MVQPIQNNIISLIEAALKSIEVTIERVKIAESLDHPTDISHGDFSSNIALSLAKQLKREPLSLAIELVAKMIEMKSPEIEKVEVAGRGFINMYLSKKFFENSIQDIIKAGDLFGRNETMKGKLVLVEYTDPNPFKQFHIGHLMSNTIGESLSRIFEWNGAEVKRICYQGDAGMHVAQAVYGLRLLEEKMPEEDATLSEKAAFLGKAYAAGSQKIKNLRELIDSTNASEEEKKLAEEIIVEVKEINKKIYTKSNAEINTIYKKGKEWSLEYFEEMYRILGTSFDQYFFESELASNAKSLVEQHLHGGVFEKSDGAVVFKGETHGLHTRVFINSEGLPTYEAKELALAQEKFKKYPYDLSVVVTANEINEYFKVLLKVLEQIQPELAKKTKHISHGVMKLSSGKMSSRTGNVITAESLINDLEEKICEKMKERKFTKGEEQTISEEVSVAALKYSILRQAIGRDSIFDPEKALSFEGDSGPYLQYAHTRALSILAKAKEADIKEKVEGIEFSTIEQIHHLLYRFSEIIERSFVEYAPQYLSTYLLELAASFNSYYAAHKIIDIEDSLSSSKIALTHAFQIVIKNGLDVLGIKVPEKM